MYLHIYKYLHSLEKMVKLFLYNQKNLQKVPNPTLKSEVC